MENNVAEVITKEKNITIKKAAEMMGKSEQYVRIGLRNNRLPFRIGSKVKYTMDIPYITATIL